MRVLLRDFKYHRSVNRFLFSPILYWLFNYLFDIFISILWFSYSLIIYYVSERIFNDSTGKAITEDRNGTVGLNSSWNLRFQFYPLTILIVLPTLPFVYLLTKVFKNDIVVSENQKRNEMFFFSFDLSFFSLTGWSDDFFPLNNHSFNRHYDIDN